MPRALQWLGCGMGAVSCDASYQRIAQPSIERGGLSTCHSAASSSASVTNRSCECPVCGPLTLHDVGPIVPLRPSDPRRGPLPRDAATASLTHSGYAAPSCLALRIRRYCIAGGRRCTALCDVVAPTRVTLCAVPCFAAQRSERGVFCVCRDAGPHSLYNAVPREDRSAHVGHAAPVSR
jgi:hypothetical protein